MTERSEPDWSAAHEHFSAYCFNECWSYLGREERSAEEGEAMLHAAMASFWHWSQRSDCTPTNCSIGAWQISRVYAVLGRGKDARSYAQSSLKYCQDGKAPPFYEGYAFEALARAEIVAQQPDEALAHLMRARGALERVDNAESAKMLEADLAELEGLL